MVSLDMVMKRKTLALTRNGTPVKLITSHYIDWASHFTDVTLRSECLALLYLSQNY
jgi:transposase InsO family protein